MNERLVCIYCVEAKPVSAYFKAEHVLPQSFGRFAENLTLHQVVCDDCNAYFGATIDRDLARGSMDGLDRYRFGVRPASEYAHLGRHMTRSDRIKEGPYAGLRLTWSSGPDGDLTAVALPQLGLRREGTDERVWMLLSELPEPARLPEQGLSLVNVLWTHEGDAAATAVLEEWLAESSAKAGPGELPSRRLTGPMAVSVSQPLGASFFRVIAKIGLNYVASQFGAEVARHECFDTARRYVRHGEKPFEGWYSSANVDSSQSHISRLGHSVGIVGDVDKGTLEAVVSLHLQRVYRMRLSSGPVPLTLPVERFHFFDLEGMRALPAKAEWGTR